MDHLHLNTISEKMSTVLDELMGSPWVNQYVLVGGTALSLQLGHRKSIDLDLFTTKNYDPVLIKKNIHKSYPVATIIYETPNSIGFNIHDIKVEFVEWKEGFELEYHQYDQWRLLKKEILASMKLNAILNRTEKKDYADLSFLLKDRPLKELLHNYKLCYPYQQVRPVLEKLSGNSELIDQTNPVFLSNINWSDIELSLKKEVGLYYKLLKKETLTGKKDNPMEQAKKYKKDRDKGLSM